MAFYDWNHDGKDDFIDDFMEYEFLHESTSDNDYVPHSGEGISTFGAIVATIGGLFMAAAILAGLGCTDDTPVFIILILWIVCGTVLCNWFDNKGF